MYTFFSQQSVASACILSTVNHLLDHLNITKSAMFCGWYIKYDHFMLNHLFFRKPTMCSLFCHFSIEFLSRDLILKKSPVYPRTVTADLSFHVGSQAFWFLDQALLELDILFFCKVNINNGFAVFVHQMCSPYF